MEKSIETVEATPETAVAEVREQGLASLSGGMTAAALRKSMAAEKERRQIVREFVRSELVEGVDFGKAFAASNKPTLLKPGQEKIFGLFSLTSTLEKDTTTLEMLEGTKNVVAYLCKVWKNGQQIAEGRGAAVVGDKGRDINSTVKIAEKRARMDACLSLGFSEYFTQDLEDPEYREKVAGEQQRKAAPQPDILKPGLNETKAKEFKVLEIQEKVTRSMKPYRTAKIDLEGYPAWMTCWSDTMNDIEVGNTYFAEIEKGSYNGKVTLTLVKVLDIKADGEGIAADDPDLDRIFREELSN